MQISGRLRRMNFGKIFLIIFASLLSMLVLASTYRVFSEAASVPSPKAAGLQWLYWLVQFAIFVISCMVLTKFQAKRSSPTKFLIILNILFITTFVCVVSVGYRLSRPAKGMSRFPQETTQPQHH